MERKTQQGGPVRSRKGRERNDSPYIEERTRSSNKNARREGDEQRQDQERRGTGTKKSLSLEILGPSASFFSFVLKHIVNLVRAFHHFSPMCQNSSETPPPHSPMGPGLRTHEYSLKNN
ncbi:hypothetical protein TNCV_3531861 [Trichonephila clavipes]|nr:hypothetical protein TNCV_3531861 [Trichonephila clavipes]